MLDKITRSCGGVLLTSAWDTADVGIILAWDNADVGWGNAQLRWDNTHTGVGNADVGWDYAELRWDKAHIGERSSWME